MPHVKALDQNQQQPRWPRWHPHGWSERVKILAILAIAFAVWGWVDVRLRGTVDPDNLGIHKTDLTVYTEAGAAFFDGRKPYEVTNPRGWGYLYPPPFAMLMAPLHALPTRAQTLVWFALSVAMAYGCYSESVRIARVVMPAGMENAVFGPVPLWLGWTAVAAAALPALNCLQRGQVGVAKLYLLLLGFRLCIESTTLLRSAMAGLVLALPIALKITPLVPVGFLVCQQWAGAWLSRWRAADLRRSGSLAGGVALGLVLTLLLLPAAAVGWRANLKHLETWSRSLTQRMNDIAEDNPAGDSSSPRNQSLVNAVERFGNWNHYYFAAGPDDKDPTAARRSGQTFFMDAPLVGALLLVARAVAACLLMGVGWRAARSGDALAAAAGFGLACTASLVLAPIARGHYYVLLLPAVMFTSSWLRAQHRHRAAVWMSVIPLALVVAHYAAINVAGRVGVLGIGTTIWYLGACVMLARGGDRAAQTAAPANVGPPLPRQQTPLAV